MINDILEMIYYTHDNGGRTFQCKIIKKHVRVFREDEPFRGGPYDELVLELKNCKKIFIGDEASSILVEMPNLEYYYIGHCIYRFQAYERIKKYTSPIGNSDVPYPVAYSKTQSYFMLDYKIVSKLNIDYEYFYDHKDIPMKRFKRFKMIAETASSRYREERLKYKRRR